MNIISRAEAIAQGLNKFFTGKPCKRGHISEYYVSGGCIECRKLRDQTPEKRQYMKEYNHTDQRREYISKYNKTDHRRAINAERQKKYRPNKETRRKYYLSGLETLAKYRSREDVKACLRFNASKRHACKLQRTPIWSDLNKIKEIYANCPPGYEVDHIIPLQGELVSGLHVPDNLQYLTKSENCSKGNHFDPMES